MKYIIEAFEKESELVVFEVNLPKGAARNSRKSWAGRYLSVAMKVMTLPPAKRRLLRSWLVSSFTTETMFSS